MSFLIKKLRNLSFRIFNFIENNGNADFETNGEEHFIDRLCAFYSEGTKTRVFFDIGANIGNYSRMIEKKCIKNEIELDLHLFEPTKSCFSILETLFDTNLVTLNNFGVSDHDEFSTIYFDKENSALASLYQRNLGNYGIELQDSEEVKLRRIEGYVEEKKIKHIDFVKIDIEGHELKALHGFGDFMTAENIDFIQFEYGGANLDSHTSLLELFQFLNDKGFVVAKVMRNGLEIREYMPFMDNFQYSNYVAISKKVTDDFFHF